MHATQKKSGCGCRDREDCDGLMNERLRYFMGRHLTARDFCDEQAYHRSHRLFHNRILHGWGVVCGLEIKPHRDERCALDYVEVSPGVAIDCCGREVVVECCASCEAERLPRIPWEEYKETHPLLVLNLCYHEEKIDQVAVLSSEGDCSYARSAYGRVCEDWKLSWAWVARADLPKHGWTAPLGGCCGEHHPQQQGAGTPQQPQPGTPTPAPQPAPAPQAAPPAPASQTASPAPAPQPGVPQQTPAGTPQPEPPKDQGCPPDDCDDPCAEGYHGCAQPKCPPGHCIPLAVICPHPKEPIRACEIVMHGRPHVPYAWPRLTHVVDINWPHGGIVTPRWIADHMKGTFVVTFNRRLKKPLPPRSWPRGWGINEATFQVQFGDAYEDLDTVPAEDGWPKEGDNLCTAEYKIHSRKYHHEGYDFLVDHIVWITLKGDFIRDCHDLRIDGDRDHREGGTFQSWLSVVSDEEYKQLEKDGQL